MRTTLLTFVVLGIAATASTQGPLRIEITDGSFRSAMRTSTAPYMSGAPWAAIPAQALKRSVEPTVALFRIRAWSEGDGVRVLVFAVDRTDQGTIPESIDKARETQIASVLVARDGIVEVTEPERFNARRITLIARRSIPPYIVQQHGIDIPVRPWSPPRRP